ncbi:hypothetical protein V8E55_004960 [Tylopilus felleus]
MADTNAIRRLVALSGKVEAIVDENDRRLLDGADPATATQEQNHLHCCYKELVRWVPSIQRLLGSQADEFELRDAYKELNDGADGARGDDTASLKIAPPPKPLFKPKTKAGHGFYHEVTGELLCPTEYNWNDKVTKRRIRNLHTSCLVTAYNWPGFLYKDGVYDPNDRQKGLFKGKLLMQAFKHIFTSPSSTSPHEMILEDNGDSGDGDEGAMLLDDGDSEPPSKRFKPTDGGRTRSHVAALLGMRSVQPRAIAYIAVQLRFALSNCRTWRTHDGNFDHQQFYDNIVNWFERPRDSNAKVRVDEVLLWWNRNVFGPENAMVYCPQPVEGTSAAATLMEQCGPDVLPTGTTTARQESG